MNIEAFRNRKIAVLGFGVEGQAVLKYLDKQGVSVTVFDALPFEEWGIEKQELIRQTQTEVFSGPNYLDNLVSFDIAFRSPGVWRNTPKLIEAEKQGMVITSQVKLFFQHCPSYIIGVTGTKGKGTTSALITHILTNAIATQDLQNGARVLPNTKVYLTGNIGSVEPLELLDQLEPEDVIVYELSSFQLQDLTQSPQLAVVLMITEDHLDHHASTMEYHEAKQNIVRHQTSQDFAVINVDYPASRAFTGLTPAQISTVSANQPPHLGCYITPQNEIFVYGFDVDTDNPFIVLDQVLLRGRHNLENIAAATAVTLSLGIKAKRIQEAVKTFRGLEHRLELVGTCDGIQFFNDSFATVPETTIAAIQSFEEPLILIVGGSEKHSDFNKLGQIIAEKNSIKAVILIGETAPRIKQAIQAGGNFKGQFFEGAKGMKEIFEQINQVVRTGDVVLLSPGCASFGMFANYKNRGQQFKQYALLFGKKQ